MVFLARHESLDRQVALKVIRGAAPELLKRFEREALAAAAVVHPGLARIYDAGRIGEHPYLALEYIRGQDLKQLLEDEGPQSLDRAVDLTRQMLLALEALHAAGLIHRDLKPANLMLDEAGVLKVMDLGLVHMPDRTVLTQEGQVLGTPQYWPPEMVQGEPVDRRADLYQAGAIAFELVNGRGPYKGVPMAELPAAILTRPFPPLPPLSGRHAARWPDFIARLTARDPAARFESAKAAVAFLDRVDSRSASDRRPGARSRPVAASPRPIELTVGQGHRPWLAAGGLGLAVAIALAAWPRAPRPEVALAPDSPRPAFSPSASAPPPLTAADIDQLISGLADAVQWSRDRRLAHEMSALHAKLKTASPAARAAETAAAHARWRNVLSSPRFSGPVQRYLARAAEAWASPALTPTARGYLLFRTTALTDLLERMERPLGFAHGYDLARLAPPVTRPLQPGPGARVWAAWMLGDAGLSAGRRPPVLPVALRPLDPVSEFSANDADVLYAAPTKRHKVLAIPLESPLPAGVKTLHVAYRLAGGSPGQRIYLRRPNSTDPAGLPLAAFSVGEAVVSEGAVAVDARALEGATTLELRPHGRPLEMIERPLSLDYVVLWIVP